MEKTIKRRRIVSATCMRTRNGLDGLVEYRSVKVIRTVPGEGEERRHEELWIDIVKSQTRCVGFDIEDLRRAEGDDAATYDIYYTETPARTPGKVFRTATRMYSGMPAARAA